MGIFVKPLLLLVGGLFYTERWEVMRSIAERELIGMQKKLRKSFELVVGEGLLAGVY